MKRILIGGIGNVLLDDDGIGPWVVRTLAARYQFSSDVAIEDLGTPGLEMVDYLAGKDAVVLIDSVKSEHSPGTIRLYRKAEVLQAQLTIRTGPHEPSLAETLLTLDLLGAIPEDVLLIGVVGQSYGMSCRLSAPVRMAVELVIAEILGELTRLHVSFELKQSPEAPDLWWAKEHNDQSGTGAGVGGQAV